jgi:hypothetical protein
MPVERVSSQIKGDHVSKNLDENENYVLWNMLNE